MERNSNGGPHNSAPENGDLEMSPESGGLQRSPVRSESYSAASETVLQNKAAQPVLPDVPRIILHGIPDYENNKSFIDNVTDEPYFALINRSIHKLISLISEVEGMLGESFAVSKVLTDAIERLQNLEGPYMNHYNTVNEVNTVEAQRIMYNFCSNEEVRFLYTFIIRTLQKKAQHLYKKIHQKSTAPKQEVQAIRQEREIDPEDEAILQEEYTLEKISPQKALEKYTKGLKETLTQALKDDAKDKSEEEIASTQYNPEKIASLIAHRTAEDLKIIFAKHLAAHPDQIDLLRQMPSEIIEIKDDFFDEDDDKCVVKIIIQANKRIPKVSPEIQREIVKILLRNDLLLEAAFGDSDEIEDALMYVYAILSDTEDVQINVSDDEDSFEITFSEEFDSDTTLKLICETVLERDITAIAYTRTLMQYNRQSDSIEETLSEIEFLGPESTDQRKGQLTEMSMLAVSSLLGEEDILGRIKEDVDPVKEKISAIKLHQQLLTVQATALKVIGEKGETISKLKDKNERLEASLEQIARHLGHALQDANRLRDTAIQHLQRPDIEPQSQTPEPIEEVIPASVSYSEFEEIHERGWKQFVREHGANPHGSSQTNEPTAEIHPSAIMLNPLPFVQPQPQMDTNVTPVMEHPRAAEFTTAKDYLQKAMEYIELVLNYIENTNFELLTIPDNMLGQTVTSVHNGEAVNMQHIMRDDGTVVDCFGKVVTNNGIVRHENGVIEILGKHWKLYPNGTVQLADGLCLTAEGQIYMPSLQDTQPM